MKKTPRFALLSLLILMLLSFIAPVAEAGLRRSGRHRFSRLLYQYGPGVSLLKPDSLEGWTTVKGGVPKKGWEVLDGTLHRRSGGGDIVTEKEYGDFVLDFSWTIAQGGNSGIKYRFNSFKPGGWLGCEYQVLDDFASKEGTVPKHITASLYDIQSSHATHLLRPHDQVNHGRIVVTGNRIRHYLNGRKVVDIRTDTRRWDELHARSKFSKVAEFGKTPFGKILVQDHGDEVWFHHLTIREIKTVAVRSCHRFHLFRRR